MTPIRLKTVYDATRTDPTGLLAAQLRLHVASWRAHVRSASGLTVTSVGQPSRDVVEFLSAAGADLEVWPRPHDLASRSPTYNKHLAAPEVDSERVFLADNDTVYVADIAPLADVPVQTTAAALADNRRIAPEIWERLRAEANIKTLPLDWIPWKERVLARRQGRSPVWERYAYFNSGAILFPVGEDYWRLWEAETRRLSAYLEAQGLDDREDVGSDQLSLTSAAAEHGDWQLLPAGFNVRPFHFQIPDVALDEVNHLHMVATGRTLRNMPAGETGSLTAFLRRYWERMVFANVTPDKKPLAALLLDKMIAIVADFDLDQVRDPAPGETAMGSFR
ncbi:MAG TPA: hypothetical protein VHG70_07545 [Nocardioidaceae bacterium]|nr:hypothetical protein [Nocardioidaceae bacterium]